MAKCVRSGAPLVSNPSFFNRGFSTPPFFAKETMFKIMFLGYRSTRYMCIERSVLVFGTENVRQLTDVVGYCIVFYHFNLFPKKSFDQNKCPGFFIHSGY